jgi:hypothetical protein
MTQGMNWLTGKGGSDTPQQSGGWSQSSPLQTGNTLQTVQLQEVFEEAYYYTVQFGIVPPAGPSGPAYAAVATIEWSVQGNTIRRQVSVGNGTTISGPGEAIRVVINDTTSAALNTPGLSYTGTIQVTKGTRPADFNPPTLADNNATPRVIPPGGLISVAIPQNVGITSVEITSMYTDPTGTVPLPPTPPNPPSPVLQIFQTNPPYISKQYTNETGNTGFVDVAPGATEIQIYNLDASDNVAVTITWGIDG